MARFQYHARDGQGELATGTLTAGSLEDAGRMLRSEGKFIVQLAEVDETEAVRSPTGAAGGGAKVKRVEVILFAQQLAVMVETGVPLSEALDCAAEQASGEGFRAVLGDVSRFVQGGQPLAAALRQHPRVFPPIMVSLVHAGEISGTMSAMLDRISRYLATEHKTLRQVRGALIYPCFMACMALGVTLFLLTFVLPRFATIYESRQAVLPGPTRLLLAISHGLLEQWYLWLALLAASVGGVLWLRRTAAGRRLLDALKLRAPVLRTLFSYLYLSRAARTMATMLAAGVSMLDMIAIVRQVTCNVHYEELWDEVDQRLRQGAQLSEPLFASPLIPRSVSRMISSGEKSGRLGQVMGRIAEYTEAELESTIKTVTQFVEPLVIACMGAMIGFVAIALLLPIFNVGRVVAGN